MGKINPYQYAPDALVWVDLLGTKKEILIKLSNMESLGKYIEANQMACGGRKILHEFGIIRTENAPMPLMKAELLRLEIMVECMLSQLIKNH